MATVAEEYDLEYGTATLELHPGRGPAGGAGSRRRRRSGHRWYGEGRRVARGADRRQGVRHRVLDRARFPERSGQARRSRRLHVDPVLIPPGTGSQSFCVLCAPPLDWFAGGVGGQSRTGQGRTTPWRAAFTPASGESGPPSLIEPLLKTVRGYNPKADLKEIQRAYEVAEVSHEGQKRLSGEDFILHPVAVATILADLHLDTTTIIAALLHDTVEDTELTVAEIEEEFGDDVAHIVDGLTKLDRIEFKTREQEQAENVRKMVVAMAGDIRVLLIKLADRLHNMRTLSALHRREAAADRDRDAGDLRAAREPLRRPGDEVGARGSVLQDAPPRAVPRDREPGRGASRRAQVADRRRHDVACAAS